MATNETNVSLLIESMIKSYSPEFSQQATTLLETYYCQKGETPAEALARAAVCYSSFDDELDEGLARRIYGYVARGHAMFASPVLSNAVLPGQTSKSMPISCFLSYVPDTIEGLIGHTSEFRWLSVNGGGVGGHWNDIRAISEKAPGPIPFLHCMDADTIAYQQGKTRKGSYAAYMNVSHPDIVEFINSRLPTGDINRKNLNVFTAINVTDEFMRAVETGDDFKLVDPHTRETREKISARQLWETILTTRTRTGLPYLNFIDTINREKPAELKRLGLKIHGSNLCNEIHLPTDETVTAVCCLSSVNLATYDEWKDTSMVDDMIRFLDNVLEFFIRNAPPQLAKARRGAVRDRALGLGAMGWHSLLQKRGLPFGSKEAYDLNDKVFSRMRADAMASTKKLAVERGECWTTKGTGKRNSHLLAVAPNANSSMILDTSSSIEPYKANAYTHRTRIGSHLKRNPQLETLLTSLGKNTPDVWSAIVTNKGSVATLDFLTREQKDVFKTASEINQHDLIRQAARRQRFICQGQSLNLFFRADVTTRQLHKAHALAWKLGCKGLYYLRAETTSSAETVTVTIKRDASDSTKKDDECVACQG